MKGKASLWDAAVEPVSVSPSFTFKYIHSCSWMVFSGAYSHCKHTHTIYTHTLTQEATALITDHSRKVCHYFKFRTFLKVHKLLKSAFGQNSVIRLKGIPSCACGFLRWMWDTVACVQLSQIASVILALLFFLPPAEDHPYRVPLLLSCVPSLWRLFEWGVTYLC